MPNVERLKLIQGIIDRMARNSFALKGWAITLTSALLSLTASRDDQTIAAIAIYVLAAMATLDAYYLALERAYRQLYPSRIGLPRLTRPRDSQTEIVTVMVVRAPASHSASHTNSQPVQASTAMSTRWPTKRATQLRTDSWSAGMRPRCTFARLRVDRVESDLSSVHVEPGYDRHWGLL